jgi:hypothetical protein
MAVRRVGPRRGTSGANVPPASQACGSTSLSFAVLDERVLWAVGSWGFWPSVAALPPKRNEKFAILAVRPPYEPTPATNRWTSWRPVPCRRRHVLVRLVPIQRPLLPPARTRFAHHSGCPVRLRLVPKQARLASREDGHRRLVAAFRGCGPEDGGRGAERPCAALRVATCARRTKRGKCCAAAVCQAGRVLICFPPH